jgi:hypothetical protein
MLVTGPSSAIWGHAVDLCRWTARCYCVSQWCSLKRYYRANIRCYRRWLVLQYGTITSTLLGTTARFVGSTVLLVHCWSHLLEILGVYRSIASAVDMQLLAVFSAAVRYYHSTLLGTTATALFSAAVRYYHSTLLGTTATVVLLAVATCCSTVLGYSTLLGTALLL